MLYESYYKLQTKTEKEIKFHFRWEGVLSLLIHWHGMAEYKRIN